MRSRAQSVVELALVAPILILLLVAILELGRLMSLRIAVEGAAREGAYLAATRMAGETTDQEIRDAAARESTASGILPDEDHVTVAYPAPDVVLVTVRSEYAPLVPLTPMLLGSDPVWISASVAFPLTVRGAAPAVAPTATPLPPTATSTPTETPTPEATPSEATETVTATPTATPSPTAVEAATPTPSLAEPTPAI